MEAEEEEEEEEKREETLITERTEHKSSFVFKRKKLDFLAFT